MALFLACFLASCSKSSPDNAKAAGTVYNTQGVIKEIHPQDLELVIDAQAIPGFMDAMTMPYPVKDASLLKDLKPGESISFDLLVSPDGGYSIQSLAPLKSPSGKSVPPRSASRPDNAAFIHIPQIGEAAIDEPLVDQDGRPWRIKDERGKIAALTFIYTSCPLQSYCPRSMQVFANLKRELGDLLGRRVDLLAVTFDPTRDTPKVLKRYGENFGAGAPDWRLLTGQPQDVEKFVSFFDVNYWSGPNGTITDHSLSTALIDPRGRVALFETGNHLSAQDLAQAARKILAASGSGAKS